MDYTKRSMQLNTANASRVSEDAGLRSYMQRIYQYMALALAVTGVVAFAAVSSPAIMQLLYTATADGRVGMSGFGWLVTLLPLAFVMLLSFGVHRLSLQATQLIFWSYAAAMGISLSSLFAIYTGESVARVFFITASVFGAMSIYGHTTKRDLTGFGSFLIMGLFGIIIASLVNVVFLKSSGLEFTTSLLGTFIFIGLTAYNTQSIRGMYYQMGGVSSEMTAKLSIQAALTLYLDFINIFVHLLRFMGDRRS